MSGLSVSGTGTNAQHGAARAVRTATLMGTVASIHIIGSIDDDLVDAAADDCFGELTDVERVFSPFLQDSDISRMRRGELRLENADKRVAVVHRACEAALDATDGLFDAWHAGWFDPTGYVKGWATDLAAHRTLAPLLGVPGVEAVGIGVGGDMQLFTSPGSDWLWRVGVADPAHPGGVVATLAVRDGAVATSGTAERGSHIVDPRAVDSAPRSKARSTPTASATVVADRLEAADLWATTAVIAGFDDLGWIAQPGPLSQLRSGMLVASDGRVRRWARGVELTPSNRSWLSELPAV
ncbi:MAG: FAD:protein FMN transferase [Humibacter sp.]